MLAHDLYNPDGQLSSMYDKIVDLLKFDVWCLGTTHKDRYVCMGAATLIMEYAKGKVRVRVLDAGCSDGKAIINCKSYLENYGLGVSAVAVDCDQKRIEKAKENSGGVEFMHEDITNLKFEDKFDVVVCLNVIRFVKNASKAKILQSIHRILRPGGMLVTGVSKKHAKALDLDECVPKCPSSHSTLYHYVHGSRPVGKHDDTRALSKEQVLKYTCFYS